MNILFTHTWLKETLETNATAEDIAKNLPLYGPFEIESLKKIDKDWLYQVEVTNNRPDAFSVFGFAKECQAILPNEGFRAKYKSPNGTEIELTPEVAKPLPLKVKIEKKDLCPRFTAIILDCVKIAPSPKEIAKRLELSGIRAINNVVDVSNYLMLELGQPMHTFDYDKIINSQMILRESREGEKVITLDGVERTLPKGAIVIEDKDRLIDLCGIMGGKLSEVDDNTKRVLLFVQTYNPLKIRKTTQAINHRTEASSRFEKGLDTESVLPGIARAVYLLKQSAGAKIASELIDIYPKPYDCYSIKLTFSKLNTYLGKELNPKKVRNILNNLGLKVKKQTSIEIESEIPSYRAGDIQIEEDLIEEVARIYGYHNIGIKLPRGEPPKIDEEENNKFGWQDTLKTSMKNWGFYEVVNFSFSSKGQIFESEKNVAVELKNPLSEDMTHLRTSLIPSLIQVYKKNKNLMDGIIGFFEIANVYFAKPRGLPIEELRLAILINEKDYKKVKGILEAIFNTIRVKSLELKDAPSTVEKVNLRFEIYSGKEMLGYLYQIEESTNNLIYFIDLNFIKLTKIAKKFPKFKPIPKFPPIIEDLTVTVDEKVTFGSVRDIIFKTGKNNINKVQLVDLFRNSKVGQRLKSLTLRIYYQSKTKTLTGQEVAQIREKIKNNLKKKLEAQIRE